MAKEFDCIVYMKSIRLEITVPVTFVWEFMYEFGEEFAFNNPMEGGKDHHAVDDYHAHPNGWHVMVTIALNQEEHFYKWFDDFCKKRDITFRGPDDDDMV